MDTSNSKLLAGVPKDSARYNVLKLLLEEDALSLSDESKYEPFLLAQDAISRLIPELRKVTPPDQLATNTTPINCAQADAWSHYGVWFQSLGRHYEALQVFEALYEQLLAGQTETGTRLHKGLPLAWMGDSHRALGNIIHGKRYYMLTLCEDAITGKGVVDLASTGVYPRLVWLTGMPPEQLHRYAKECWEIYENDPTTGQFPESVVLELDQQWKTEVLPPQESGAYVVTKCFCHHLLDLLGKGDGRALEKLTHYLMASIPGCFAYPRRLTPSSDLDVFGIFEGPLVDFRSEVGRYFVSECKDQQPKKTKSGTKPNPVSTTDVAKFCNLLDSVGNKFGIVVSICGIAGEGKQRDADLECLKLYQRHRIAIVSLKLEDLAKVANGENLLSILRDKYMTIRLNLEAPAPPTPKRTTTVKPRRRP